MLLAGNFLSTAPRKGMTEGGIFPAIYGTFMVTVITAVVSVPLGALGAIYLNEYATKGRLTRLIRMAIRNLAGVPSVVFGLFGVGIFVVFFGFGASVFKCRTDIRDADIASHYNSQ